MAPHGGGRAPGPSRPRSRARSRRFLHPPTPRAPCRWTKTRIFSIWRGGVPGYNPGSTRLPHRIPREFPLVHTVTGLAGAIIALALLPSCSTGRKAGSENLSSYKVTGSQTGRASHYSVRTNHGTRTASGQALRDEEATAAHRRLPLGTKVLVRNLSNGKSELVTITDRGPYVRGRIIDVTVGVARRLGFVQQGLAQVELKVLEKRKGPDPEPDFTPPGLACGAWAR